MEDTKTRKPLNALILSFFGLGLGQLYNGQPRKAITIYLLGAILAIFCSYLLKSISGMITALAVAIIFFIVVLIDAVRTAIKIKKIKMRQFNRWYLYLVFIILNSFLTPILLEYPSFNTKSYHIPTGSMKPTIQPGDRILTHRNYYEHAEPIRGNIATFIEPNRDKRLIKRIIGLPGETIEIKNKKIFINNLELDEPYAIYLDNNTQTYGDRDNMKPIEIPQDHFFLLGDNRDNSFDSRHFGFVDRESLIGKPLYIFWSKSEGRFGKKL